MLKFYFHLFADVNKVGLLVYIDIENCLADNEILLFMQIDNLVKGASGQAIQNLNLMMGYPEGMGLQYQPLFP